MTNVSNSLLALDTASLYFRAFFGVPDSVRAPDGSPVNAVRGLLDMVARLVTTYQPTHLVCAWDDDWRPQWRTELIPSYKAHRVVTERDDAPDEEEAPDDLNRQVPVIREALSALGIPVVGAADYEADDVIGTLVHRSRVPVDVVTGDRDLFQLVDDSRHVRVLYTARGVSRLDVLDEAAVVDRYAIRPQSYVDFAVLRGDPSDGLPGVKGIGEKTAAALLDRYGTLEAVMAAAADSSTDLPKGQRSKLLDAQAYVDVAPTVVRVASDVPIDEHVHEQARLGGVDLDATTALTERWGLGGSMSRAVEVVSGA